MSEISMLFDAAKFEKTIATVFARPAADTGNAGNYSNTKIQFSNTNISFQR